MWGVQLTFIASEGSGGGVAALVYVCVVVSVGGEGG